jgi:valyl-tRNA synthetase
MIMLGCHFMLDVPMPDGSERTLKDAVPFREVYIHALVRDADRQKMSKTKGNVIDPIDIIRRYGTDAVRFTLASMASPGTDIAFSEARTEGYRAFANKIWNAARFIFMQMERAKEAGIKVDLQSLPTEINAREDDRLEARWITARLKRCASDVDQALTNYRFDDAANLIYQFFWGEFCDWYLEIVKIRLNFSETSDKTAVLSALITLLRTFDAALRLLSPFMPFLTEEIWYAMYDGKPPLRSIALSQYPEGREHADDSAEIDMALAQALIVTVRALRKDIGVEEKVAVPIQIARCPQLQKHEELVQRMARVSDMYFVNDLADLPNKRNTLNFDVAVLYEKPIDVPAERERLSKDLAKFEKEMESKQKQLHNEGFLVKAPANVVDGLRTRADELTLLIEKTRAALDMLDAVGSR